MIWLNLANKKIWLWQFELNQFISQLDNNKTRNLIRSTYITKRGQTWGDKKRPSLKKQSATYRSKKRERDGDRGGGRKKVSSIPQVSMAKIEGQII